MAYNIFNNVNKICVKNFKKDLLNITKKINSSCLLHCSIKRQDFYKFTKKIKQSNYAFSHTDLINDLKKCKSVTEQLELFDSHVNLSGDDIIHRISVCHSVENALKATFPDSSVCIVGSSISGLGIGGCDLDLTFQFTHENVSVETNAISNVDVSSGKIPPSQFSSLTIKQQLLYLNKLLMEAGIVEESTIIPGRHPILNFRCNNLCCDLSINNRYAFHGTNLMKLCVHLDNRVMQIHRLVTYWGKHCKLVGGPMKFKSYSIFLLVVYFLQTRNPPILPRIDKLLSETEFFEKSENWTYDPTQYIKNNLKTTNSESLETLLRDFFFYYSNFDFSCVISTLKVNLVNGKDFILENPMFELNAISVQDPLYLSLNVTTGVSWKYCKGLIKGLLSVCNFYHEDYHCPSSENWGIISILDQSPALVSAKEIIEMEIPLKKLTHLQKEATEFQAATEKLLRVFKDGLLFQFEPVTDLNHPEYDFKYLDQSGRNLQIIHDSCYCSNCVAIETWYGRSNYISYSYSSDEKSFLNTEQLISKDILKSKHCKEDRGNFELFFKTCGFYKNNNPYLYLSLKSAGGHAFKPNLRIFLKEYILKFTFKYL